MADIGALVIRRSRQTASTILRSISRLVLASAFLCIAPNDTGLEAQLSLDAGNGLRTLLQLLGAGSHRIHVCERLALDDIKGRQR
jgi:hypothetical protein